jgi:Tol biopolymer transport system component
MRRFAMAVLATALLTSHGVDAQDAARLLKAAMNTEVVDGDLKAAIEQYQKLAAGGDRLVAAQALLRLAGCYQKLGSAEARTVYERVLRDFSDFAGPAAEARSKLAALQPALPAQTRQVARQVWTDASANVGPSADGRYFSFPIWSTGDLALRDIQTGTTRRLSDTGGWLASGDYATDSIVSSDGREVAYSWFAAKDHMNELRLISTAVGARPQVIVRTERNDYFRPSGWSTDGRQLFVIRALPDATWQIGTVAIRDGSYRSLKSLAWRNPNRVSVSPDGRYLAYAIPSGERGSPNDIHVLAADASDEAPVVQSAANDMTPLWSPDGSSLLFLSNRTGSNSIWQVPIRDGRAADSPRLVKSDVGRIDPLGITRDGALYYLVSGTPRRNIYVAELDGDGRAGEPALLTDSFQNANTAPSWSRDGQHVAYYSFRNPMVLVIRSMKSGQDRTVSLPRTVVAPFQAGPKWFPDGRSVLVVSDENPGAAFHRVQLDTGQIELLWRMQGGTSSYDVSPDGRSIFYVQQMTDSRPFSGRLVRVDLEQRQEVELKKNEWFITLSVSPDGSQVAVLKSLEGTPNVDFPSAIDLVPAAGGPSREVFRAPVWLDGSRYNALAWTADQRFLLFARGCEANCPNVIWRVPVAGGAAQEIGLVMPGIKSPAVHPDGRRIVFGSSDGGSPEVWALENFLK